LVKYYAVIGDREYEIEIDRGQVFIDGEPADIDLRQSGAPELYSMLIDGASFEMLIEAERQNYAVTLRGEQFRVQVEDERTRRLNAGREAPALPQGELPIKAPIPGLVVNLLVEPGQAVENHQPLLILEAMKMENEIRAPRDGTVHTISVEPGMRVEQGGLLLTLG
jgi:biotin carboxyl carrier protein